MTIADLQINAHTRQFVRPNVAQKTFPVNILKAQVSNNQPTNPDSTFFLQVKIVMTPATSLKLTKGRIQCAPCCTLSYLPLCLVANKPQHSLNSFTNYIWFPEVFPHIPHFEIPVFRILKNINSLQSEQIIVVTNVATLSEVLNYTRCYHHYIKICLTEKEETCLVLI